MRAKDGIDVDGWVIEPLGETTLLVRLGKCIDSETNARVHALVATLRAAALPGVRDIVPAYASLALVYAPIVWAGAAELPWRQLADAVCAVLAAPPAHVAVADRTTEIPVCYDAAYAPDLDALAQYCALTPDELIARHVAGDYRVAMLGFAPGFPYLIGLDPALHAPRRPHPRQRVAAGSVAIGGAQTGIYPHELPGGWQIIGRTPLTLFDAAREPPSLLGAGDRVRFRSIEADEFAAIASLRQT